MSNVDWDKVVNFGLLATAGGLFAGGIWGLKKASQHNAEVQKEVEKRIRDGRIVSSNGRVTHHETKINEKGQREHVVSIIEYRDQRGDRYTIRSPVERFISEQIDVCYEKQTPSSAFVCKDGVTDPAAVFIGSASVLAMAAGGGVAYAWMNR